MQGYYQEAGRAGRDGRPSECVLLYSRKDIPRLARMQRMKSKAVRLQDTINLTEARLTRARNLTLTLNLTPTLNPSLTLKVNLPRTLRANVTPSLTLNTPRPER